MISLDLYESGYEPTGVACPGCGGELGVAYRPGAYGMLDGYREVKCSNPECGYGRILRGPVPERRP